MGEKILSKDKKESVNTGKLANISRISPPISLRPSKEVLVKFKFYKGKGKAREIPKNTLKKTLLCSSIQEKYQGNH